MSGSLAILVAKGKQDIYLTDNPSSTYFRPSYNKYTNFSHDIQRVHIDGDPKPGGVSTAILRSGADLMGYMYLTKRVNGVLQPDIDSGDIEKIEFFIGDQRIDRITTDQLVSQRNFSSKYSRSKFGSEKNGKLGFYGKYHYPLGFDFCNYFTHALPLVCLQYHTPRIRITWGQTDPGDNTTYELWGQHILLDTSERERFTKPGARHRYLIEQNQEIEDTNSMHVDLVFNHPVSVIYGKSGSVDIFGDSPRNVTDKVVLQINGTDVGEPREVVPHYTTIPSLRHANFAEWNEVDPISNVIVSTQATWPYTTIDIQRERGTNVNFMFPFCLTMGMQGGQPTGSCNFSRIDIARLVSTKKITSPIYAKNYNILEFANGMGGILFGD